jgi:hypothetical protein
MVDQRVRMSSCRLRRELSTGRRGVPSARGGNAVGLSGAPEAGEVVRQTVCTSRKSGVAVLFRCEADGNVRQGCQANQTGELISCDGGMVVPEARLLDTPLLHYQ